MCRYIALSVSTVHKVQCIMVSRLFYCAVDLYDLKAFLEVSAFCTQDKNHLATGLVQVVDPQSTTVMCKAKCMWGLEGRRAG